MGLQLAEKWQGLSSSGGKWARRFRASIAKPTQKTFLSSRTTAFNASTVGSRAGPTISVPWELRMTREQRAFSRTAERTGSKRSRPRSVRLLPLASQGRHEVSQSDAEVVFLGGLKNRVKQLVGSWVSLKATKTLHHCHCGTAGHPMPVDRRLRIASA